MISDAVDIESAVKAYTDSSPYRIGSVSRDLQACRAYAFEQNILGAKDSPFNAPLDDPEDAIARACDWYGLPTPAIVRKLEQCLPPDELASPLAALSAGAWNPAIGVILLRPPIVGHLRTPLWLAMHECAHAIHSMVNDDYLSRYPDRITQAIAMWNSPHGPYWAGTYFSLLQHMADYKLPDKFYCWAAKRFNVLSVPGMDPAGLRRAADFLFS